jgi:hypothetical protein
MVVATGLGAPTALASEEDGDTSGDTEATEEVRNARNRAWREATRAPRMRLRLQPRFELGISPEGTVHPTFWVRRGRVGLRGSAFVRGLRYRVTVDLARLAERLLGEVGVDALDLNNDGVADLVQVSPSYRSASRPILVYAYLEVKPWDALALRVGQFKVWDSLQRMTSSASMLFPERPLAVTEYAHGFDLGLALLGSVGDHFEYQVSVMNGSGRALINTDRGLLYAVGLAVHPTGRASDEEGDPGRGGKLDLSLGVAARFEQVRPIREAAALDVLGDREGYGEDLGLSGGVRLDVLGIHAAAEAVAGMSWEQTATAGIQRRSQELGGFVQASYALPFGLEPGLRAGLRSEVDWDTGNEVRTRDPQQWEFGGVLNLYLPRPDGDDVERGHDWKIQLSWTTVRAGDASTHQLIVQHQAQF